MRAEQASTEKEVIKDADQKMMKKVCGGDHVLDTDQESVGSSSEDLDSPRSVVPKTKIWRNYFIYKSTSNRDGTTGKKIGEGLMYLHRQILRVRDEDSHIGEDINIADVFNLCGANKQGLACLMLFSRPVLPASPLAGKTAAAAVKASD
ncbi:hypothetical protein ACH5RR_014315 [Cinchona calisaya]|uniref:Uncharacterized protein n=1 Tax=Cinchona calisaya TaxID=153742 RepID=A0ABD3A342_9GENT